jgi:hypothetical protein
MRALGAFICAAALIAGIVHFDRYATIQPGSKKVSIAGAIRDFNEMASTHFVGRRYPPLQEREVLSAIEEWMQSTDASDSPDVMRQLRQILTGRELPAHAQFRHAPIWQVNDYYQEVWWIRLSLKSKRASTYLLPICETLPHKFREVPPEHLMWGPPSADGLQAASYLVPSASSCAIGQSYARRVAIRNVGQRAVTFEMPMLRDDERLTPRTSNGQSLAVRSAQDRTVPSVQICLAPKDCQILYHARPIKFAQAQSGNDECVQVISHAGQTCLLSSEIEVAIRGAGKRTLQTAEIELVVCEQSAGQEAQRVPRGLRRLANDELIGQRFSATADSESPQELVAGFHTVRGSTSSFAVDIRLNSPATSSAALVRLIRRALRTSTAAEMPSIRIRTDENGRPDPVTWTLVSTTSVE